MKGGLSDILPGSCRCWQRKRDNLIQKNKQMSLSDILQESGECCKRKSDNSIQKKLTELIKKVSDTPLLPRPCFKHDWAGRRTLLSCSHVSSMTSGYSDPIYYRRVVSVEKGSVIARYKKTSRESNRMNPINKMMECDNSVVWSMRGIGHYHFRWPYHL